MTKTNSIYWNNVLIQELTKESDRAAAILVGSLFDEALKFLLKTYLTPIANEPDDLLDDNRPLSTFSARISAAYRLGLISTQFAKDLNLFRKIRNQFSHEILGCDFSNAVVKSRVQELMKSSERLTKKRMDKYRPSIFPLSTRGDFQLVASWMLHVIYEIAEETSPIRPSELEWGYTIDPSPDEINEEISSLTNPTQSDPRTAR